MTQLATKGRQAGLPAILIGTQTPFARRRVESFLAAKLNFACDRYLRRRFRNFLLEKRIVVSPWLDCTIQRTRTAEVLFSRSSAKSRRRKFARQLRLKSHDW